MADELEERQERFAELGPGTAGATWLAQTLGIDAGVRWYGTDEGNPSRQLKNKLSQAASAPDGLMVLSLADQGAFERAREALIERWGTNVEWPKAVACVALSYPRNGRQEIASVVVWKASSIPQRIKTELVPGVEIVEADRPKEPDAQETHGDPVALAAFLCVDEAVVRDWLWLIEDRRAVILYGPPGTGKTFIARRLAEHLQPQRRRRRFVQLHPSFGYEEFFEGYRPTAAGGQTSGLQLTKADGPLRELVRAAEEAEDENAVMVLDEVNRGNLPRVFGELYFLIEYRDAEVSLMYSPGEHFTLPPKVTFIGTMNTADRSVAVLDQALRRRFHFIPLFPGEPPVDGMLRRFLRRHCPDMVHAADLLDLANERLPRHYRIGPSHLMRQDLDEDVLDKVWRYSVLPSVAEQFFDREDEMERSLSLPILRSALSQGEDG